MSTDSDTQAGDLCQTTRHKSRLGIFAVVQAVSDACANGNDILERAT